LAEAPSRPSRESLKTPSRAESRVAHENPESLIPSEIAAQWAKEWSINMLSRHFAEGLIAQWADIKVDSLRDLGSSPSEGDIVLSLTSFAISMGRLVFVFFFVMKEIITIEFP
jgi:hypothetical protein